MTTGTGAPAAPAASRRQTGKDAEIVIVGAGPAGLSAAHFLKRNGYHNVTVIERLGRVGGLCFTITEDYTCFDLGANYLTPDYRETLKLAAEFALETYAERNFVIADFREDHAGYRQKSPWQTAKGSTPLFTFLWANLRYIWLRWRLGAIVDPPGHAGDSGHPELCVSFLEWIQRNGLGCLERLFEMPIAVMGYGYLKDIPAPYALKYLSLPTYIAMCIKAVPLTSWWPWPKRFILGYQWLWQNVARELNVWLNSEIKSIERNGERLVIDYVRTQQNLNILSSERDRFEFDQLILACPLSNDVLGRFLRLSAEETRLFSQVITDPYCMISLKIPLPNLPPDFAMATIPLPPIGTPWAITRQSADSNLIQFYSRLPSERELDRESTHRKVLEAVHRLIARFGGDLSLIDDNIWHSFDCWPYFMHVNSTAIAAGFYDQLEALQGTLCTYYVGGLLDFELVERTIRYSKKLVNDRFPADIAVVPG
jgi:uncharacterized protein with NAD-binding domain and iron-sulfur cluster